MNREFLHVISASTEDRRGLFLTAANRLGTTLQNVEKDFWVCLVLDLLFNYREANEPRLLFKGGTSLSKAYGLISRFSEDLDITIFREDLGQNINVEKMERLSGKQQRIHLNNIKQSCQKYIQDQLKTQLNEQLSKYFASAGISSIDMPVISDPDDNDQQTLLVKYPTVNKEAEIYVKPTVKIEAGAKSALDPHQLIAIKPYIAEEMLTNDLIIPNIVTINPERTFWDKVIVLHGLRRWYDNRGQLRHQGHRISRHYYDIYKLMHSSIGKQAQINFALAQSCSYHAKMFFNSKDLDLDSAHPGSFSIMPTAEMAVSLKQDYRAMSGMIFGKIPDFPEILDVISQLEQVINHI